MESSALFAERPLRPFDGFAQGIGTRLERHVVEQRLEGRREVGRRGAVRELVERLVDDLAEAVHVEIFEGDADDPAAGDEAFAHEMEEAGQELAARQISRRSEEHDDLRILWADARRVLAQSLPSRRCALPFVTRVRHSSMRRRREARTPRFKPRIWVAGGAVRFDSTISARDFDIVRAFAIVPDRRGARTRRRRMQIALVGLGKMGANMARRLMRDGHECVVYDLDRDAVAELVSEGATGASDLAELVSQLRAPRAVWVMVPCGAPTEAVVGELRTLLTADDVVIDGGNSHYKDDVRRARELQESGLHYVDVGTSGGVWGLERGYCLMVGASDGIWHRLRPVFASLAPGRGDIPRTSGRRPDASTAEEGYLHCGPPGAGHFVKMIHNGIEYGMMQAYAEGFDILRAQGGDEVDESLRLSLDVGEIAEVWRRGSVVTSWLLDLTAAALAESPELDEYSGHVADSGEGRWTVEAAVESGTPAEVLTSSLYTRFRSRKSHTFAEKILSAMRAGFGGHREPR